MKRCLFPGCGCNLRQKFERFCSLHLRILEQNNVAFMKRRFYKCDYEPGVHQIRGSHCLSADDLKRLHEVIVVEDYSMPDVPDNYGTISNAVR